MEKKLSYWRMTKWLLVVILVVVNIYTINFHYEQRNELAGVEIPSIVRAPNIVRDLDGHPLEDVQQFSFYADGSGALMWLKNGKMFFYEASDFYRADGENIYFTGEGSTIEVVEITRKEIRVIVGPLAWRYFQWGMFGSNGFGPDYRNIGKDWVDAQGDWTEFGDDLWKYFTGLNNPPPGIVNIAILLIIISLHFLIDKTQALMDKKGRPERISYLSIVLLIYSSILLVSFPSIGATSPFEGVSLQQLTILLALGAVFISALGIRNRSKLSRVFLFIALPLISLIFVGKLQEGDMIAVVSWAVTILSIFVLSSAEARVYFNKRTS